jgi:hypothetical protein
MIVAAIIERRNRIRDSWILADGQKSSNIVEPAQSYHAAR